MPGTNGAVRVGGCAGARAPTAGGVGCDGVGAGPGPGCGAGAEGAELAIGRRPAQPITANAAKQKAITQPKRRRAARPGDARSLTSNPAYEIIAAWRTDYAARRTSNFLERFQNASFSL